MTYEIGYGKPPENTRFQKGNKYYLKRSRRIDRLQKYSRHPARPSERLRY
jgi:hypothetical protein